MTGMTNIVERLRLRGTDICIEAADEIERLREALKVMHHAWRTDNRPPHSVLKVCQELDRGKIDAPEPAGSGAADV